MTRALASCILGRMTRGSLLLGCALLFVGCAGLAKDVTNGVSNTEHEIKGERKTTRPSTAADAGSAGDGDDASISF